MKELKAKLDNIQSKVDSEFQRMFSEIQSTETLVDSQPGGSQSPMKQQLTTMKGNDNQTGEPECLDCSDAQKR